MEPARMGPSSLKKSVRLFQSIFKWLSVVVESSYFKGSACTKTLGNRLAGTITTPLSSQEGRGFPSGGVKFLSAAGMAAHARRNLQEDAPPFSGNLASVLHSHFIRKMMAPWSLFTRRSPEPCPSWFALESRRSQWMCRVPWN